MVLGMRVPCRCPCSSELPLKGGSCQEARARLSAASPSPAKAGCFCPGAGVSHPADRRMQTTVVAVGGDSP